jgi:hypothetical protein
MLEGCEIDDQPGVAALAVWDVERARVAALDTLCMLACRTCVHSCLLSEQSAGLACLSTWAVHTLAES